MMFPFNNIVDEFDCIFSIYNYTSSSKIHAVYGIRGAALDWFVGDLINRKQ